MDQENAEIVQRTREAHQALKFQQDMTKQIEARAPEVQKLMAPFRERRLRNHFIQEYDRLWRGNRNESTDRD